jgi:gamma-glutamyl-gamma-aminobutyraldehyde dehydrogenase
VFDGVKPDMTIAREEIFGPVLSVIEVASDAQAVEVANDTPYGLQASLFTANVKRAHRVARAIQAGTVTVNCYGEGDITTPFGGYKQSGFGGRDNSLKAHDQYTETKTIWIDLSDTVIDESVD